MEWIVKIEGKDEGKGARDSKEQSESESLATFGISIFIVSSLDYWQLLC